MAIPYILLTTTNLFTTQFLSYLHNSSYYLYNEASLFNQFNLLNYGYYPLIDGENIDNIYSTTSVAAVCSSNMKSFNSNEVQNILRDYYNLLEEENRISWSVNQPNMSCCVLDGQRNLLWLLGDHVGSVPLWFGFLKTGNRQDIIVTTDLFAAIYLGYSDLTAVGAGLSLPFDMETFDLLSMNHWTQYNYDPTFQEPDLQSSSNWSNSILDAAKSVIAKYDDVHLYTELDLLDASSILLECAIVNQSDFNKKLRSRYKKAPLVVDTPAFPVIDPFTQYLIELLDNQERPQLAYSVSKRRIAYERAQICHAAKDIEILSPNSKIAYLSFDSPYSEYRPYHIFFQNYFCSRLDVPILYPFQHSFLPSFLDKTRYPNSLLNKVVDLLIYENRCGNILSIKRTNQIVFHQQDQDDDILILPDEISSSLSSLLSLHKRYTQLEILNFNNLPTNSLPLLKKVSKLISKLIFKQSKSEVILLLVTSSYKEIFMNFLCYLQKLTLSSNLFVVITPHEDIELLALEYHMSTIQVTFYDLQHLFPYVHPAQLQKIFLTKGTNFGQIGYQQLIYLRSVVAYYILNYFHLPVVIADIDTIWINDPLLFYPTLENTSSSTQIDLRVTYDGINQICGCYLYLYSTSNTIYFWSDLLTRHYQLIQLSIQFSSNDQMLGFFDSEQMLLSKMILDEKDYPITMRIYIHDTRSFPNGRNFFITGEASRISLPDDDSNPLLAIIHNNFIIGVEMKKIRFQRHNLWMVYSNTTSTSTSTTTTATSTTTTSRNKEQLICVLPSYTLSIWKNILSIEYLSREIIPTLQLLSPAHNSIISSSRLYFLMMIERNTNLPRNSLPLHDKGVIWYTRSPQYSGMIYESGFLAADMNILLNKFQFSITVDNTNIQLYGNVGINGNNYYNSITPTSTSTQNTTSSNSMGTSGFHNILLNEKYSTILSTDGTQECPIPTIVDNISNYRYSIKILAYYRVHSLERLLNSLLRVDYGHHEHHSSKNTSSDIELCIHIDHPHENITIEQLANWYEVIELSQEFQWPYGSKNIIIHNSHIGLKGQWNYINKYEAMNQDLISIVLEDDVVVSSFFFLWLIRAINTYYTSQQIHIHMELLNAITKDIEISKKEQILRTTNVDEFYEKYAAQGSPVILGISLAKQNYDIVHHPVELEIRNNYSPFLLSLVGTWGTVLFPIAWQSFLTWWNFHETIPSYSPLINEDIITNKFYLENSKIWSPWMIKFATICGGKWLYPNLPGNLTLISNYREKGENYKFTLGPSTDLLSEEHFVDHRIGFSSLSGLIHQGYEYSCLWYFPTISRLSRWQYDITLHRVGLYDGYLYDLSHISPSSSSSSSSPSSSASASYNQSHIIEMLELVEANLPLYSNLIVLGEFSPLLYPISRIFFGRHLQILHNCESPLILCVPLADIWNFQSLRPKLLHGLLIDFTDLQTQQQQQFNLQIIWNWLYNIQIRYLFILNSYCIESPTDIVIASSSSSSSSSFECDSNDMEGCANSNSNSTTIRTIRSYYTIIEDICLKNGKGMTIYRNMNTLPSDWLMYRHGLSKTIGKDLIGRRFIRKSIKL